MRAKPALGATALLLALLSACGSSSHASSTPITVFDVTADPSRNLPVVDVKHPVTLTAAAVRSTLDSLLTMHAKLVDALAHQVVSGNQAPNAQIAELAANTRSLTSAIEDVYGTSAARAFAQLWAQHTQFFIDYANAARAHNGSAKKEAESKLADYQSDFANFLTTATDGGAPLATVTGLLHSHVRDITGYIDADANGDAREARRLLAASIVHMRTIASAVTDAIVAQHLKTVVG